MRFFILLFSLLILSFKIGFAAEDTARALYDQGKYQEALDALQKNGVHTAAEYYNAGNCLYKLGRVGQSLAYYEKAHNLAPRNSDIQYNLELAEEAARQTGSIAKDQS